VKKLSAAFFIFLIIITWATLIGLFWVYMLFNWLYDLKTTPEYSWLKGTALSQDLVVNRILGGDHKTYVSSVLGNMKTNKSRGGTYAANFVDWWWKLVFKQANHCIGAMKPTDIYDFSARRAIAGVVMFWLNLYLIYLGVQAL